MSAMPQSAATATPPGAASTGGRGIAMLRLTAELACGAAMGLIAARALWFAIYGASIFPLAIDPAAAISPDRSAALQADASHLARAGLFEARRFADTPAEPDVINAPETRLDLILHGVRRSQDPDFSTAVVQAPGQPQRSLGIGATIVDGVTLEAVFADRVIINRRGARESLFLREETRTGASLIRPAGQAQPPEPAAGTQREAPPSARVAQLTADDVISGLVLRLERLDGAVAGYRVAPESRAEVLAELGLAPGDLVTELNGRALDRPADILDMLEDLENARSIRLTVLRQGEAVSLEAQLP